MRFHMLLAPTVALAAFGSLMAVAWAAGASVQVHKITAEGVGEKIGTIELRDGADGLTFKIALKDVPAGKHGFHVHEKGDCGPGEKDGKAEAGLAAGGHYDPEGTKTHEGPTGAGHKGDSPLLEATSDGVDQTVIAPRLKLADVQGRAIVIHEGGDTYSDIPEMGGGKGRIACGVVPKG